MIIHNVWEIATLTLVLMEILLILQTILVIIAVLQCQIAILVQIQPGVIIIDYFFLINNCYLFCIGLSCINAKYLKNDKTACISNCTA